jgi:hypothetical protein
MVFNGATNRLLGRFNLDGQARTTVRRGSAALTTIMQLNPAQQRIDGTVSDGTWASDLIANLMPFTLRNPATNFVGKYTMTIAGVPGSTNTPAGNGYATMSVGIGGTLRMAGSLADNAFMSEAVGVSGGGEWPLYVPLYGGRGVILGWVSFSGTPAATLDGNATWIRPAMPLAAIYKAGFTNATSVVGSSFYPAPAGVRVLSSSTADCIFSDGGLSARLTDDLALSPNNVFTSTALGNPYQTRLVIDRTTGLMRGSFFDPGTSRTNIVLGVVLQVQDQASGYFRGAGQTGAVSLTGR